ncbi:histone deacetylase family protein [Rhodovibrionaceae bacterium A322]
MKLYCSDIQKSHYPKNFLKSGSQAGNPEKPERLERLLSSATAMGCEALTPDDHGMGPIAAIHTPEYLTFLKTIYQRWQAIPGASAEVIPNVHLDPRDGQYPKSPIGQAGYHMADTACPISAETYQAVIASAHCAVSATKAVLEGDDAAYALSRPPGHHAYADKAGGFCYLNNSAIAAQELRRRHDRVAVIDVDLHHGNGTQGIFYRRKDVMTVSVHADPTDFYPFFVGYAGERGDGDGLGYNLNVPLPLGSGDDDFIAGLEGALDQVAAFCPDAIVVALGLDASQDDPFGGLAVTTEGFGRIGETLASLQVPSVIVQEGGYLCDSLGDNLVSFLSGFEKRHRIG